MPSSYDDQVRDVERKRRMALLLRQQSMQPQLQDAGRFAVGPSALSGIASLASALRGSYLDRQANTEEKGARTAEKQRLATAMQRFTSGDGSTPVTPQQQAASELVQSMPLESQQQVIGGQALSRLFPSAKEGYSLAPGAQRYDGNNKLIATAPLETKPEKPTIGAINPGEFTPASIAKYKDSGNYADLIPAPKPQADKDVETWRTMTPEEIQGAGLPPGTAAERSSKGRTNVLSKRDNTGSLSQKDATTAKNKLTTIQLARQQLDKIKQAYQTGTSDTGGPVNAFGPGQGMLPTQQGKQFDAAVDQMRSTITSLTRTPGVGSMSDYETRLDQGKFPSRSDYESVTAQKIQGLDDMLALLENGYTGLLSNGATAPDAQAGAQPAAPAQPAAATPAQPVKPAGAPVPIKSDAEFDALPSGAEFIAPDGSHRRKP